MYPTLSVIIRTKNEARYLGQVITRLREQSYEAAVEIIVVDSGSTDKTLSIAEQHACRIVSIKPEDFSFGRALNLGIKQAEGEIVINLSGHSVPVNTDYFQRMAEPFSDQSIAATYGRDVPWPDTFPCQARDILNYFPDAELDGSRFSNANGAIRKSCLNVFQFDETISAAEDILWAKQIMNSGYKIQYVPKATVYHSHSPSLKYIYKRSYVESRGNNSFAENRTDFSVCKAIKFYFGQIINDSVFTLTEKYSPLWLFHIPLYRLAQTVGLYTGFKAGARSYSNMLSRVGQYAYKERKRAMMPKALLVTHCFFPESIGGTETYTLKLATILREKGWDITIVSALRDISQKRYKVIESKYNDFHVIKIINAPEFCTSYIENYINHDIDDIFGKILQAEKPDIVHFQHTAFLSSRLPEIAYHLSVPSVFTLHDYWYMCFNAQLLRPTKGVCPGPSEGVYCATCYDSDNPGAGLNPRFPMLNKLLQSPLVQGSKLLLSPKIKQKAKKFLYKKKPAPMHRPELWPSLEHSFRLNFMRKQLSYPAAVISPSLHLKKRYEDSGFREITFIPHGLEPKGKIHPLVLGNKLIMAYLGNIIPIKGAHIILKELEYVNAREAVEINLYGRVLNPFYQKELESLSLKYPQVNVSFMGPYNGENELKDILSAVHCVIFPSLWEETFSFVVREALLYGVPVISSSLGAVSEVVRDGINGLVFNPYKEGDLADKINLLLSNRQILTRITEGARNTHIGDMETHGEQIMKIYERLARS